MPDNESQQPYLTARNPRALVEIALGHPVDWSQIDDIPAYIEEVLQTPYEQLFDPRFGSPIYLGAVLDANGRMTPAEFHEPPDPQPDDRVDVDRPAVPEDVTRLADFEPLLGELPDVAVRSFSASRAGGWTLELGPAPKALALVRDRIFDKSVYERLWWPPFELGWTPDGMDWVDNGEFFNNAAEYFDPLQGGLGDCWLIAAMSSVAWALPTVIADRQRAVGTTNDAYKHRLTVTDPATHTDHTFEVSNKTLAWSGTHSQPYAHSSESDEVWPGIVEKAFAQWRQNTTSDRPNLTVLNGGDPVGASAALTGRQPQYFGHSGQTTASLINLVKSHSISYRTFDPMTAWTYDTAPAGLSYADANIVANHAYSVLGWTSASILRWTLQRKLDSLSAIESERLLAKPEIAVLSKFFVNRDYVVLRNPWGYTEGTVGALSGTISMRDIDFWRTINLGDVDGVFAIDFDSFRQYFAGTGVAV